jgi:hypothetical protein
MNRIELPLGKKNGAKVLRDLVLWLNDRDEYLNDNKSILTLISEYQKYRESVLNDNIKMN